MKRPEKITEFQCQERLYLYATQKLPESEKLEVEDALKDYETCRKQLKDMQKTFHYCLQLRRVLPDKKLLNEMGEKRSLFRDVLYWLSLSQWKEPVQIWVKAAVILLAIIGIAFFVPWQQIKPSQWMDLAFFEQNIVKPDQDAPALEKKLDQADQISFEGASSNLRLLRVFLKSSDIDEHSVAINQIVNDLGATKVDSTLTWQRQKKGSSFHFYLDQAQHKPLLERLKNFGPVRIYQEENGREMPANKIRIIMWVSDTEFSN